MTTNNPKAHAGFKTLLMLVLLAALAIVMYLTDSGLIGTRDGDRAQYQPGGNLHNTQWLMTQARIGSSSITEFKNGAISLNFSTDRISGRVCNSYGGDYTFNGFSVMAEQVAATKMACLEGNVMLVEDAFFATLGSGAQYYIGETGGVKTLELVDIATGNSFIFTEAQ